MIEISAGKDDGSAIFAVKDKWTGIAKEDQPTISERFTQTAVGKNNPKVV